VRSVNDLSATRQAYLTEATLTFSEIPLYERKLEFTSPRTDEIIAQLRGRPPPTSETLQAKLNSQRPEKASMTFLGVTSIPFSCLVGIEVSRKMSQWPLGQVQ
jgi:hypothetical protein